MTGGGGTGARGGNRLDISRTTFSVISRVNLSVISRTNLSVTSRSILRRSCSICRAGILLGFLAFLVFGFFLGFVFVGEGFFLAFGFFVFACEDVFVFVAFVFVRLWLREPFAFDGESLRDLAGRNPETLDIDLRPRPCEGSLLGLREWDAEPFDVADPGFHGFLVSRA
jgi:hypothetical protein